MKHTCQRFIEIISLDFYRCEIQEHSS